MFGGGSTLGVGSYLVLEQNSQLELGENVYFENNCEVTLGKNSYSNIGADVYFNAYTILYNWKNGNLEIGKQSRFGRFNLIAVCPDDSILIGEQSLTARNVSMMSNDGHPIYDIAAGEIINLKEKTTLKIDKHVWIGNGGTIMSECIIGKNCMVGANSFVRNKKFPNNCIIAGNPAKVIRKDITWNKTMIKNMYELEDDYIAYTED